MIVPKLFRAEAIEASTGLRAGDVLLTRPAASTAFSLCAIATLLAGVRQLRSQVLVFLYSVLSKMPLQQRQLLRRRWFFDS